MGDPEFLIDFPETLPARFPVLDFAIGDVEEGLGDHLLARANQHRDAWLAGALPSWSALRQAYDGLAGLAEALAVFNDHSPGRTQPTKD